MASLRDGTHLLSNIQWRHRDRDTALRPVRGFTTGTLTVNGSMVRVEARFNDQNLSNRFSDLEEDGVPVTLQVTLLGNEGIFLLPSKAPTLERAGACYILRTKGSRSDASPVEVPA